MLYQAEIKLRLLSQGKVFSIYFNCARKIELQQENA
jgi:hypothetical protein